MPFYKTETIELLASAAQTSSSNSAAITVDSSLEGRIYVDITTVTGTSPTLDIIIQDSNDTGTTWFTHTTIAQQTTTGQVVANLTNFGNTIRINYTIGGTDTPTFTFKVVFIGKG